LHHLRARCERQDQTAPGGPESLSEQPYLPGHCADFRRVSGLRRYHIVPLKGGGADEPGNMQWQTKEAAKAKDRIE
jgi:hypothetical protein